MKVTLEIDPDILAVAKEISATERVTIGAAISQLARKGLELADSHPGRVRVRNGVPVIAATGHDITADQVRKLLEEEW
jgi:hypothetical protein